MTSVAREDPPVEGIQVPQGVGAESPGMPPKEFASMDDVFMSWPRELLSVAVSPHSAIRISSSSNAFGVLCLRKTPKRVVRRMEQQVSCSGLLSTRWY